MLTICSGKDELLMAKTISSTIFCVYSHETQKNNPKTKLWPPKWLSRAISGKTLLTRMHSSRMHTARSLTVSRHIPCMPPGCHACPPLPHMPPGCHAHPPAATHPPAAMHAPPAAMHAPQLPQCLPWLPCMPPGCHACPPVNRQTPVKHNLRKLRLRDIIILTIHIDIYIIITTDVTYLIHNEDIRNLLS